MNAELFADRYELLHEAPPGAAGRLFEARDTQTGEIVALKILSRELLPTAPERGDIERFFKTAEACRHPRLMRFHALALDEGYLVREWLHGFPLVDLLRSRRELPAQEVVALLHEIPEAIDTAVQADFAPIGDLLTRLFVCWERSVPPEELVRLRRVPVTSWSGFIVKLNPASLSQVLPLSPDETMNTLVSPLHAQAGPLLTPSAAFAEMIYQLLGAPRRSDRTRRYVPLGTLNESGNMVLRRILEGGKPPASCSSFWQERRADAGLTLQPQKPVAAPLPIPAPPPVAAPPPLPKRRSLRIPDVFLGNLQPGTILRLTPRDPSFTPIHLITRPTFRIGRSLYHADFITRVLPETPENEKLTKEIGRVHALAELQGDRIFLRDGNGEQASVNGCTFDDQRLSHDTPTLITRRGLLTLYRNYELEIAPLLGSSDLGWQIENENAWPGPAPIPSALTGAVVFYPKRNQPMLRQSAWLFSRLDFALTPRGDVSWCEAGTSLSQASFLYHRGHFWLAAFAPPPGAILVNRAELAHDTVAPLVSGQPVQLGPGSYIVEVQ